MTKNDRKIPKFVHTSVECLFKQCIKISMVLDSYSRSGYKYALSVNYPTVKNYIVFYGDNGLHGFINTFLCIRFGKIFGRFYRNF